jgi:hypothetical protein
MAVTEVWTSQEDLEEFMRMAHDGRAGMPARMDEPPTWDICEVDRLAFYAPGERADSSARTAGSATS